MHKELLLTIAKRSVVLLTLPILLLAFSVGPDPRHTGAPGDQTCARSGCHTGTALNAGTGRVVLQLPGGMTYVPGQRQRIAVVITGDATTRRYGYQASARLGSNEANGQAGTFTATAPDIILCQSGNERPAAGCGSAAPLEFISHGNSSNTSGRFEFDWTAPATDVGPVKIYVSANAANGNGSDSGDKIYTTSVTLMPAATGAPRPAISATGGVVNGASFSVGVVAGSWTTIFGSNFATALKTWDGLIDAQGNFPTAIDNVRVTIDGLPASMNFISANQINVQAPALTRTGMVPVVVTTPAGASEMVMANVQREAPGLFLFTQTPTRFPAAVRSPDGQFIAPAGLFPGVTTEPAKPQYTFSIAAPNAGGNRGSVWRAAHCPAGRVCDSRQPARQRWRLDRASLRRSLGLRTAQSLALRLRSRNGRVVRWRCRTRRIRRGECPAGRTGRSKFRLAAARARCRRGRRGA